MLAVILSEVEQRETKLKDLLLLYERHLKEVDSSTALGMTYSKYSPVWIYFTTKLEIRKVMVYNIFRMF